MKNNSKKNIKEILELRFLYTGALKSGDKVSALNYISRLKELYESETNQKLEEVIGSEKLNKWLQFLKEDSLENDSQE